MHTFATGLNSRLKAELLSLVSELPESGELIRAYKGRSVYVVSVFGRDLIIKSYEMNTMRRKLRAMIRCTQADRSYRGESFLREVGVETPKALALIREGGLLANKHYLVSDYVKGAEELGDYLLGHGERAEKLAVQTVDVLEKLASGKITHGDFHQRNFLVTEEGLLVLIDLDSVKKFNMKSLYRRQRGKDIKRLLTSVEINSDYHRRVCQSLSKLEST